MPGILPRLHDTTQSTASAGVDIHSDVEGTHISMTESSRNSTDAFTYSNKSILKFSACLDAVSLFGLTVRYVEYHTHAEWIVIDDVSMGIEATIYEDFVALRVAICVRPTQPGSSSEVSFSSMCGRDVVGFHHLFSRASKFLRGAATSSHVCAQMQLEFLNFDEHEKEGETEEEKEAAIASFIVNLSSHRAGEREETTTTLAASATYWPDWRRRLSAVIMRKPMPPVLSGLQQLLRPESIAEETACLKSTIYPVLVLVVRLAEDNFIDVEVAQALHSMLAELDLCHCSTPVRAELASALDGLSRIVAGQH
jgi:hypothetical protein